MKNDTLFTRVSIVITALLGISSAGFSQEISIIPEPVEVEVLSGSFPLTTNTHILYKGNSEGVFNTIAYFQGKIKQSTGFKLPVGAKPLNDGIEFRINDIQDPAIFDEGYVLLVEDQRIVISANHPRGLFYGVQTLLQLLPEEIESPEPIQNNSWEIPGVRIVDFPRFSWRGIMLDVSRHFFSKQFVKEYIDQIARYKFNRLHMHLSDDHGWRIEIKSLPKLTETGAWRVPRTGSFNQHAPPMPNEPATYGGFYTQEDMREIISYAKERYIEILPEIDVPGHSMAVLASYPELGVTRDSTIRVNPGSRFWRELEEGGFELLINNTLNPVDEKVYDFLEKVFTEIAELFPFEYIHIGGDECYKGFWLQDEEVLSFMQTNAINSGEELQSYFTNRVSKIIAEKGKTVVGWDEILEGGVLTGAVVMSWRGLEGGIAASKLGHNVILSPNPEYYLDLMQGDRSIEAPVYSTARLIDTYTMNLLPEGLDPDYVLGGQGNLWTEQVPTEAQAEYMTYPRIFAIAETVWSPKDKKNWKSFVKKTEKQFKRLDYSGINYSKSMYDPIVKVSQDNEGRLLIDLSSEIPGADIYYTVDNTMPCAESPKYNSQVVFPPGADMLKAVVYSGDQPMGHLIRLDTSELRSRLNKEQ